MKTNQIQLKINLFSEQAIKQIENHYLFDFLTKLMNEQKNIKQIETTLCLPIPSPFTTSKPCKSSDFH